MPSPSHDVQFTTLPFMKKGSWRDAYIDVARLLWCGQKEEEDVMKDVDLVQHIKRRALILKKL